MKTFFEQIAQDNDWFFSYGQQEYINLEETDKEMRLYIQPIEETPVYSPMNNIESTTYSGRIMLLVKSNLDDMYDAQLQNDKNLGRYEAHIKRCKQELSKITSPLLCSGYQIKQWKIMELINMFDENTDGVLVNFSIERR